MLAFLLTLVSPIYISTPYGLIRSIPPWIILSLIYRFFGGGYVYCGRRWFEAEPSSNGALGDLWDVRIVEGRSNLTRYKRMGSSYRICKILRPLTIVLIFSSENLFKQERFRSYFGGVRISASARVSASPLVC